MIAKLFIALIVSFIVCMLAYVFIEQTSSKKKQTNAPPFNYFILFLIVFSIFLICMMIVDNNMSNLFNSNQELTAMLENIDSDDLPPF